MTVTQHPGLYTGLIDEESHRIVQAGQDALGRHMNRVWLLKHWNKGRLDLEPEKSNSLKEWEGMGTVPTHFI